MKEFIDLLISMVTIIVCFSSMSDSLEKAEDFMSICFLLLTPIVPICYAYGLPNTYFACMFVVVLTVGTCKKLRRGRPLIEFD